MTTAMGTANMPRHQQSSCSASTNTKEEQNNADLPHKDSITCFTTIEEEPVIVFHTRVDVEKKKDEDVSVVGK